MNPRTPYLASVTSLLFPDPLKSKRIRSVAASGLVGDFLGFLPFEPSTQIAQLLMSQSERRRVQNFAPSSVHQYKFYAPGAAGCAELAHSTLPPHILDGALPASPDMTLSTTNTVPHPSTITSNSPDNARDPHVIPVFDSQTLTEPGDHILYLPPLLSSLPERISSHPLPPQYPPRTTETRLPDIDPASLSLHKALHHFRLMSSAYAEKRYEEAFNWSELVLPDDEEREWYCVVFRSKRKAGSDSGPLYEADKHAHEEAIRNGGLILYWYGVPEQKTGLNLATCIWQSRRHAVAANSRPSHLKAMKLAAQSYEIYTLERHILRKQRGSTGVTIVPYHGGEVGW